MPRLVAVVGPNCVGKTVLAYCLVQRLVEDTNFTVAAVDLEYRQAKTSLESLTAGVRHGIGLYSADMQELPLFPVSGSDRLFIVPPGAVVKPSLGRDVAERIVKLLQRLPVDVAVIDVAVPIECPVARLVTAYADVIIAVSTPWSPIVLDQVLAAVDPKPKVVHVLNMVTDRKLIRKARGIVTIPFCSKIFGRYDIEKIQKLLDKHIRALKDHVLGYISNLRSNVVIDRKVLLELLFL